MSNLPETEDFSDGTYQIETSDRVLGGPGGIANKQAEQLGNRTAWLKAAVAKIIEGATAVGKATQLATARTLRFKGAVSGSGTYDGGADTEITLSLVDSGIAPGTYTKVTINAKGLVTDASSPTTLGGYGITDATTAAQLNQALSGKADKATTLGGYGITDVYTATYMDELLAQRALVGHAHSFSSLTGKPTTLGGYGITDVYTAGYMDDLLTQRSPVGHTHTFSSLAGKPTTLGGYAIDDAYTKAQANVAFAAAGHTHTFSSLTGKPTTLGGYGITDVYTAQYMDGLLAQRVGADSITGAGFINGNQGAPYFRGTDGAIVRIAASAETHTVSTFMKPVAGQWISLNGSPAVLPAGGTWAYFKTDFNLDGSPYGGGGGIAAGGTTLTTSAYSVGFAWRIQ